jgi:hypothetical protein
MRKSKLVQQKFSRISGQLGTKNLELLDYRYIIFLDEKLPLIVGHMLSKCGYFWSKINPRTDSKTEPCAEPHCAENCPEFTMPRAVRGPYVSRKYSLRPTFDLFIKLLDKYT